MSRSEPQTANSKQQTARILLFAVCCLLFTAACRSDMQDQPKMKPYRGTSFFKDGLSSRPPVAGTVARGLLNADSEYFTGKKIGRAGPSAGQTTAGPQPSGTNVVAGTPQGAAAYPDDVEMFPLPVTQDLVVRGKERYEIFCSACHGLTGNGDGMIVRRGFRRAASFNDDRLRQAPVGHFFDAISNGWGAMPSYSHQIPVKDRWAIIAYIRALQLSQEKQSPTNAGSPAPTPVPQNGGHQ